MKKLFTLSLFLLTSAWAMAQDSNTFQFVDKDGNVVADGTTVDAKNLAEDVFLGNYISTGLSVKNVSAETAAIRMAYQIELIDNGDFQICFPMNCIRKMEPGTYNTESGSMNAGEIRDMQCEWFPTDFGTCKVKLSIEVLSALGLKTADGPTITVIFTNTDPSGIIGIHESPATTQQCFSVDGRKKDGIQKGLNIIRMTDGTTIKLFNK